METKSRISLGIVIAGIIIIFQAAYAIFTSFTSLGMLDTFIRFLELKDIFPLLLGFSSNILLLVCGIYVFKLKNIMRLIALIILTYDAISALFLTLFYFLPIYNRNLYPLPLSLIYYQIFTILLLLGLIIYLTRPKVKEQFK